MNRRFIVFALALTSTLVPRAGSAQAGPTLPAAETRTGTAMRADVGPTIDGVLDEAAWSRAEPLTGFVQHEPVEGAPASEETEVRILFDEEAIYVGAWLRDREPDRIIVGERIRDANLADGDAILVVLDTYRDQQSGFVFGTNPSAIEYDGQVRGEGGANTSWDGSWTVGSSRDGQGWYAEMRIPFSTLRHGQGEDQTWGLNVTRYIGRKNEQVVWSPVPRQFGFYRLTEAGLLRGLQPPLRRVATITPYVLGAAQRVVPLDPDVTWPREAGVDAKLGITPSLAIDLTYNTDFAQVEVDDQQVDLTRFSLFFPEKRPFFLENADLFSVQLQQFPARTAGRTQLFHSRQIGVASGKQVPIEWGSRVSGRTAGVDVGLLHMWTEGLTGVQDPSRWTVARLARELPNRSRVGAIFTERASRETSGAYNRTYGVDARLGIGSMWTFNAVAGLADSPGVSSGEEIFSFVGELQTRNWYVRGYHDRLGENFTPGVGFIPDNGFNETNLRIERIFRPTALGLREVRLHTRRTWSYDTSGFKEVDIWHIHLNDDWQNGSQLHPAVNYVHDGLSAPFSIRGTSIVVPAGIYKGVNSYATFRTNPTAPLSLNGRWDLGSYLSGNRYGGTLGLTFRSGATFIGGASVSHNRIRLPQGDYNTTLTRVNAQYSFSPGVFLQSTIQFSDQTNVWSGNVRFGWLDTGGTGLFLVYNERQEMDATGMYGLVPHDALLPAERTFVVKFTRQFDVSGVTEALFD